MMLNLSPYRSYLFGFILLMWLATPAYSQDSLLLIQNIDKALKARCLDDSQTSVSIVAMPSGKVVYAHNTELPLLPASVMKIITTAAALHYLGPEYRFKTQILYSGERKNGMLLGDLIIRAGGDPTLSTEKLWPIVRQIKASGINEITGNLIIDAHFFDQYDRAPDWKVERSQRAYDAKLSALSLNYNSLAIHVQPGQGVGNKPNAWLEPALPYINLRNTAKTIKRGKNTVSVRRSEEVHGTVEMLLRGKLPIRAKERIIRLNVDNPMRYATETFRALLSQAGIKINGSTKVVHTPIVANEWYEHLSDPLSIILKTLNTYSNNLTAEQIVKTIAADRYGTPGTHAEGLRLIKEFLRLSHVNMQGIVLADGSGLSRKNRMTTRAITNVLTSLFSRFDIGPDFISTLRVMGAYGVLSQRLAKSPARGKIRAKTGSLRRVSTLAGYVASQDGKVYGYALFLNNNRCGPWKADKIEDRIVTAIHNFGDGAARLNTAKK
ncbi:MAG: D-alanyl-D-alanine carboxypeptidase/D-alanyl-D-alanine-endopeptidase [Gammaproteobacteria bacterium]|nr:MAG: D-alanyl-D-alanine carboxypeptidase/D-alanyl-D-alanine-endopeptidase [Gammaproteobacteria bacterium]